MLSNLWLVPHTINISFLLALLKPAETVRFQVVGSWEEKGGVSENKGY